MHDLNAKDDTGPRSAAARTPRHLAGVNRRTFIWKSLLSVCGFVCGYNGGIDAAAEVDTGGAPGFAGDFAGERNRRPRIALIIDDIGFSRTRAHQFMDLDIALTFSILPHVPYSAELAREMNRTGYEVMLHQPMEPYNTTQDPGPGALFVGDGSRRIAEVMEANLSSLPQVVGVNNHMGSKFTESDEDISAALTVVKQNALFFVDSCTSNHSKAHAIARSFCIPALSRRIFLDNVREESAVLRELKRLKLHARHRGKAVGIGHPFPETAGAIHRFVMDARNRDIELVSVNALMTDRMQPRAG